MSAPSVDVQKVEYSIDGQKHIGVVAFDPKTANEKLPGVVIIHDAFGIGQVVNSRLRELAGMGYLAFAADMFGNGQTFNDIPSCMAVVKPLLGDRKKIQHLVGAAVKQLQSHPKSDPTRVVVFGYCMGGTVTLEAARGNVDGVVGVASFHGGLSTGEGYQPHPIKASVIAFHGVEDKRCEESAAAFEKEMKESNADWVLVRFSNTVHSFTNPNAGSDMSTGMAYNEKSDKRSWGMFLNFLQEVTAKH